MCGKPSTDNSLLSSEEEDDGNVKMNGFNHDDSIGNGEIKFDRTNETPEERKRRRKLERKQRTIRKREVRGELVASKSIPKKVFNVFNQTWDQESLYVNQVMQCLPEVRQPGLLLEEEERTEEYTSVPKVGKVYSEEEKKERALARIRKNVNREGLEELTADRAKSYQELKERLQQKLAGKVQTPNAEKREKKLKKKLKRAEEAKEKSNKGKKMLSQTASSAGKSANAEESTDVKTEKTEKTPLKKKPVVKSNGEIVYSKFDFISNDKRSSNGTSSFAGKLKAGKGGAAKPTAEDLLKQAEKHERKISNLATKGQQAEAVDLAVSQKWDTALKRAEGYKVRDDPHLLKKSIKKQEKLKQLTKRKWKERVDRVEKQKEAKQQKRQSNIQARKDDKKKRTKKLLRKRGRIV